MPADKRPDKAEFMRKVASGEISEQEALELMSRYMRSPTTTGVPVVVRVNMPTVDVGEGEN